MARVPYVTDNELDPEYREFIVSSLQPGKTANVYAGIGNNPAVLKGLRQFFGSLWTDSGLTDRQREIVILTAASEVGSTYEWHQHVNIATNIGITETEIGAIARDEQKSFSSPESTLIAYTRAVIRGRVKEPVHEVVSEHFDDQTIVGIAVTASTYAALGNVIDALGIEIETNDQFVGWDPSA